MFAVLLVCWHQDSKFLTLKVSVLDGVARLLAKYMESWLGGHELKYLCDFSYILGNPGSRCDVYKG